MRETTLRLGETITNLTDDKVFFRFREYKVALDVIAGFPRNFSKNERILALKASYDIIYGHLDHTSNEIKLRPLASQAYVPSYEKQHLLLQQSIGVFIDRHVYASTGLDLNSFLKLPITAKNYILDKLTSEVQKKEKLRTEIENNFK